MKEVIVHIGFHKTGTSSIQDSLDGFDDGRTVYARFRPSNHSIPMTTIFARSPSDYHIWKNHGLSQERVSEIRAEYLSILNAHLEDVTRERLIISGEDISILADSEKMALCDYITGKGLDLKILCFVRDIRGVTASAIQQHIRNGLATLSCLDPGYSARLSFFARLLPASNLLVYDFAKSVATYGDIVRAFAHICDIDANSLPIVRRNESLSLQATKLILRLNRLPISTGGTAIRAQARARIIAMIEQLYPNTNAACRIDDRVTESLAVVDGSDLVFLKERFGIIYSQIDKSGASVACEKYLSDLSDVDLDVLRSALSAKGIAVTSSDTADSLLADAFYAGYHRNELEDADAPYLRDIAIKIANSEILSMEDAVSLMSLAARARPGGPMIKQKLEEWRKVIASSGATSALEQ